MIQPRQYELLRRSLANHINLLFSSTVNQTRKRKFSEPPRVGGHSSVSRPDGLAAARKSFRRPGLGFLDIGCGFFFFFFFFSLLVFIYLFYFFSLERVFLIALGFNQANDIWCLFRHPSTNHTTIGDDVIRQSQASSGQVKTTYNSVFHKESFQTRW